MSAQTVWLASYPKSGNTWVRALLAALVDGAVDINRTMSATIASARTPLERLTGLVSSELLPEEVMRLRPLVDAELNARLPEGRSGLWHRKIHDGLFTGLDGAPIVSLAATRAAIYVVRDPRDVAVSYAHQLGVCLADAVQAMGNRAWRMGGGRRSPSRHFSQHLGTWSEHVEGWLDHELFPVLLVRYEDLQEDTAAQLRRMQNVVRRDADDATLRAAVRAARFDELRAQESKDGFRERPGPDRAFFRSGIAGAWRSELPKELAARIEADHHRVMARLGYALGSDLEPAACAEAESRS
jgi:aryl sulfotransferase